MTDKNNSRTLSGLHTHGRFALMHAKLNLIFHYNVVELDCWVVELFSCWDVELLIYSFMRGWVVLRVQSLPLTDTPACLPFDMGTHQQCTQRTSRRQADRQVQHTWHTPMLLLLLLQLQVLPHVATHTKCHCKNPVVDDGEESWIITASAANRFFFLFFRFVFSPLSMLIRTPSVSSGETLFILCQSGSTSSKLLNWRLPSLAHFPHM